MVQFLPGIAIIRRLPLALYLLYLFSPDTEVTRLSDFIIMDVIQLFRYTFEFFIWKFNYCYMPSFCYFLMFLWHKLHVLQIVWFCIVSMSIYLIIIIINLGKFSKMTIVSSCNGLNVLSSIFYTSMIQQWNVKNTANWYAQHGFSFCSLVLTIFLSAFFQPIFNIKYILVVVFFLFHFCVNKICQWSTFRNRNIILRQYKHIKGIGFGSILYIPLHLKWIYRRSKRLVYTNKIDLLKLLGP